MSEEEEKETNDIEVPEELLRPPYANAIHLAWSSETVVLTFCLRVQMPVAEPSMALEREIAVQRVVLDRSTSSALVREMLRQLVTKPDAEAMVREVFG